MPASAEEVAEGLAIATRMSRKAAGGDEEVLSAAYEAVAVASASWDPAKAPWRPWVIQQIRWGLTAEWRRRKAMRRADAIQTATTEEATTDDPEISIEVREALGKLPPPVQRAMWCLAIGLTVEESAERLGISPRHVKRLRQRGVAAMRTELCEES
jgi:RNA polymerase sigma factor (sigma-70 family)